MNRPRQARKNDISKIIEGNQGIALETEDLILDIEILVSGIRAIIEDPNKGTYWVIEQDDEVVGQLMITYEWSDWRNGLIWWIQSVYVWPRHRRQGVFSRLFKHVENEARIEGAIKLRLYAETANVRAHETYLVLGFTTDHYQVFEKNLQ